MADKVFTDGMIIKWLGPNDPNRRQGAPDFVLGQISFKVDEIIPCLQKNNNNGWVNVDIKRSKGGKVYSEVDTWKPEQQQQPPQQQAQQQQPSQFTPGNNLAPARTDEQGPLPTDNGEVPF